MYLEASGRHLEVSGTHLEASGSIWETAGRPVCIWNGAELVRDSWVEVCLANLPAVAPGGLTLGDPGN